MSLKAPRAGERLRTVVTGGAGFIGSHLVDRLVLDGHEVLVIDDLSTGKERNLNPAATLERLDISVADLDTLLRSWRPTRIYHLAAQSSVARSIEDPLRDLAVNVIGTHMVAAAAEAAGARKLVFVSSGGAIYGDTARTATERTIPAPASYYGAHKLAAEAHVRLSGVPHAIIRPSNVYGPRQAGGLEGAVVAAFVDHAIGRGSITIHGDGTQTRDFINVDDVVSAMVLVAGRLPDGTWNVASGSSVSINDLADLVETAVGRPIWRLAGPRRPGDVACSRISPGALRRLGWRPHVDLGSGVVPLVREAGA